MHLKPMSDKAQKRAVRNWPAKACEVCGATLDPSHYRITREGWEKKRWCSNPCKARGLSRLRNKKREDWTPEPVEETNLDRIHCANAPQCGYDLWQEDAARGERYCWRCRVSLERHLSIQNEKKGRRVSA